MSSIATRGYRNTYSEDPKGGHQEPSIITQGTSDHINGNFMKPNMVAFKYPDFKKDVDLDAHVRVFNFVVKVNV
jgi:hypothetical protein